MTLTVTEALSPNKPNLDMTLAVSEALSHNKPNLDMTLTVAEALNQARRCINKYLDFISYRIYSLYIMYYFVEIG